MLSLFLSACGNKKGNTSIEDAIREELAGKYGISVEIHNIDTYPGTKAFEEGWYQAVVSYENRKFNVFIGKDNGKIEDDYAKYLIGESIEAKVKEVFAKSTSIANYSYQIIYVPSGDKWTNTEELERYFDETDTYVDITLCPDGEEPDAVAEAVYGVLKELEEKAIHFSANFEYKGKKLFISSNNSVSMKSLEALKEKLEEANNG